VPNFVLEKYTDEIERLVDITRAANREAQKEVAAKSKPAASTSKVLPPKDWSTAYSYAGNNSRGEPSRSRSKGSDSAASSKKKGSGGGIKIKSMPVPRHS
jgi:hypothetical protein